MARALRAGTLLCALVLAGGYALAQQPSAAPGADHSATTLPASSTPGTVPSQSSPSVNAHTLPSPTGDAAESPDLTLPAGPAPPIILEPGQSEHHEKLDRKLAQKYDVSRIGDRGIGSGVNLYSLEKEQALGHELAMEVERDSQLITDPTVTEYINRIGQKIVRNSDAKVPFIIKVIDNDEINAFALPGGYFYVNSGLILAADNEAELAGVMAHEIAHVAARHATKNATRAQIFNIASIPLIFIGGPVGYVVRQAAGLAVPMGFLKFSRDAEREADLLGIEYQYAAGYDPGAFVQFFEKLKDTEKQHHSLLAKAFSTHPMTEDRIKRAEVEIENFLPARDQYIETTSEFDEVKARLAQLENRRSINGGQENRPTLRKRESSKSGGSNDDGRPTLKKRPN